MLVLEKIQMEGFGPFADVQEITFARSGITVIYGDNMRGKTSLLNAIRYAFFGTVLGRNSRPRGLHTLSNRDLAARGRFGFSVALSFSHGEERFELTREFRSRSARPPSTDSDYNETKQLRRGSQVLGPQQCDQLLPSLLPEEVSRFFLFDGELLQEYEELLYDESEAGRKISESIEQILGVPLLKQARSHVELVMEEAEEAVAREASRRQETESLGTALAQATELRRSHRSELERLQGQMTDLRAERKDTVRYLKSVERYKELMKELDDLRSDFEGVVRRTTAIVDEIKGLMKDAWRTLLGEPVRRHRAAAKRIAKETMDSMLDGLRKRAVDAGLCEICGHELNSDEKSRLAAGVNHLEGPQEFTLGVSRGLKRLFDLEEFVGRDVEGQVRKLEEERRTLAINRLGLTDRIDEIETEIADSDAVTITSAGKSLREVERKILVVEQGIASEQEEIEKRDKSIERLSSKLEAIGTTSLRSSQERSKLLRKANDVLIRAVEDYKSELRNRVQESATQLFLKMTTEESEYASLEINENYGLDILHNDGRREQGRSAGAEHVIALALMGALQQNAPLKGPVVMDSPFARLDPHHTNNVVAALPSIADQVVLLIQEGEVPRTQIRTLLGSGLTFEYELEKISARRTNIREVTR